MTTSPRSVVLLHGFASSFDHGWRQTGWVDILSDFDCTAPEIDLPGHGTSPPLTESEAYADVEEEVFRSLPAAGPLTAVGFSAGADVLLRMAIAHPQSFEKIALLGLGDNVFEARDASTLAQALESSDEPDDILARIFYRLAVSTGNDPRALSAFIRRSRPPIREEALSTVTCPVLVVLGDRDMTPSAARLVAALPSASLVTLAGVDHFATPSDFGAIDATMRFLGLG
jgi:pimeloyl-ACP methyl ester carboxylesterase